MKIEKEEGTEVTGEGSGKKKGWEKIQQAHGSASVELVRQPDCS